MLCDGGSWIHSCIPAQDTDVPIGQRSRVASCLLSLDDVPLSVTCHYPARSSPGDPKVFCQGDTRTFLFPLFTNSPCFQYKVSRSRLDSPLVKSHSEFLIA